MDYGFDQLLHVSHTADALLSRAHSADKESDDQDKK